MRKEQQVELLTLTFGSRPQSNDACVTSTRYPDQVICRSSTTQEPRTKTTTAG